jgi:ATHILA ORF-1 family
MKSKQSAMKQNRPPGSNSKLQSSSGRATQPAGPTVSLPRALADSGRQNQMKVSHDFYCRDDYQLSRYNQLCKTRIIRPTKFIDISDLKKLGLYDDVKLMCQNSGFWEFASISHSTYKEHTLEFFSSVSKVPNKPELTFQFRLGSKEHTWSITQFRHIFGLPPSATKAPSSFQNREFWYSITGKAYTKSAEARAASVFSPVFRYILRLMENIGFLNGDNAQLVRKTQLWMLWSMITLHPGDAVSHRPDVAHFLMTGMLEMAKGEVYIISGGGLVTHMVEYINKKEPGTILTSQRTLAFGTHSLNIKLLQNMRILESDGDRYYHNHPDVGN